VNLTIISPREERVYDVVWIDIQTPVGQFVIQPGHAPDIFILSPHKEVSFGLKSGKHDAVLVRQGVLEVMRHHATLIMAGE
jgi:F0F1-type ATP synthase epsilon subunit